MKIEGLIPRYLVVTVDQETGKFEVELHQCSRKEIEKEVPSLGVELVCIHEIPSDQYRDLCAAFALVYLIADGHEFIRQLWSFLTDVYTLGVERGVYMCSQVAGDIQTHIKE